MQRYLITITLLALLALSGCRSVSYFSQGNEHSALGQRIAGNDNSAVHVSQWPNPNLVRD